MASDFQTPKTESLPMACRQIRGFDQLFDHM